MTDKTANRRHHQACARNARHSPTRRAHPQIRQSAVPSLLAAVILRREKSAAASRFHVRIDTPDFTARVSLLPIPEGALGPASIGTGIVQRMGALNRTGEIQLGNTQALDR